MITPVFAAILIVALAWVPPAGGTSVPADVTAAPALDSEAPWTELEFGARKFIFGGTVRINLESVSAGEAMEEIVAAGGDLEGLLPSGGTVDRIHTVVRVTGKNEVADTWIDAATGAVLQTVKETHGRSNYWKLRRFFPDGYHQVRVAPMDARERRAGRGSWTKHEELMVRWDPPPPAGAVVTSPYATIYLISRIDTSPGKGTRRWFISAREHLVEIRLDPGPSETTRLKIAQSWPGGSGKLSLKLHAPTLRMVPRWHDGHGGARASTGFMGMRGPAQITLLPGTGLPVRIEGEVKGAGHVTSRLLRVRWR